MESLNLPETRAKDFVEAELELERRMSRKLPQAHDLLETARKSANTIVFITDTNFSSTFIRELLTSKELCRPEDRIFASCECRVDKARGLLFPYVSKQLGVPARSLVHYGNDDIADLRNGKLSGLQVRHVPAANQNRYEKAFSNQAFATGGLSSLMAGASRLARLQAPAEEGRDLRSVSAGVIAPCLVAWVTWLMLRSVRDGCHRLYFVSRDGQVLLNIARQLEPLLRTGLDLRYLFTSRQTFQRSVSPEKGFRDLLRLKNCRLLDVAEFLNMNVDDLGQKARSTTKGKDDLSHTERQDLVKLLQDPEFRAKLETESAAVRSTLIEYLIQEGWGDATKFGVVDVGWRASMAGAIDVISAGTSLHAPTKYYFFGLSDDSPTVAGPENAEKLEAWFFDDARKRGYLPPVPGTTSLVEMFCAGDHGSVIGFTRESVGIVPILRTETSPMADWGLASVRDVIASFTEHYLTALREQDDLSDLRNDLRRPVNQVMKLFWIHPTKEEVRDWGSFPVEATLNNSVILPLAERLSGSHLWKAFRKRSLAVRSEHSWPQGTAAISIWPLRVLLTMSWKLRDELPRLRRRVTWFRDRFAR